MALFNRLQPPESNSWERIFGRLLSPVERFLDGSTSSGILLITLTLVALIVANGPLGEFYRHLQHLTFTVALGDWRLSMGLHHWINDGLMTFFFFLVGLEIKRELLVGHLNSWDKALLPLAAALGGMVMPALCYSLFNLTGAGAPGWGIPMATDIAFALGVLLLLGDAVPAGLVSLLLALAIVDDLGAVLVIALFYGGTLQWLPLALAALVFGLLLLANRGGLRANWIYGTLGLMLWLCVQNSGIHGTVAGVLCALAMPLKSLYRPEEFSQEARKLLNRFDLQRRHQDNFLADEQLNELLHQLRQGIDRSQPPLMKLSHKFHRPVYFFVLPLFVFFNAGLPLGQDSLKGLGGAPVFWGVLVGLLLGKFCGVLGAVLLCLRRGWARLPPGVSLRHLIGVALLAAIGFTMAIFVAELAFAGRETLLNQAKMAILLASLLAGTVAFIYFKLQERFSRV